MADLIMIRCPHCAAANRVPGLRLIEHPNCGRCHRPLFTGRPLELDEAGFERLASSEGIPLLVDFWAPWCGPCLQMAPAFAEAASILEPHVRLGKIDTEAVAGLGARFSIRSIPTLMLLRDGVEVARQPGAMKGPDIVDWALAAMARRAP